MSSGQTYTFLFSYVSGNGDIVFASSTGNGYYDGDGLWFVSGIITPSISFNFPTNNATTTDFTNWQITYATPQSSTIAVSYGLVSSTLQFTDTEAALAIGYQATQSIAKSQPLIYPPLVNGVSWYAKAQLLSSTSTILADSGLISFQVYFPPSEIELPITSSTIPIVNNFIQLYNTLSVKPPFGYFTAIKAALSTLSVGTTSLILVNASTTQAFSAIFTPLRTGLIIILWLMFAFWIFHRLRHLEI